MSDSLQPTYAEQPLDAVERAFEERQRLFVEAGTGVGKSFAYLIPAIRRIVERGEPHPVPARLSDLLDAGRSRHSAL